MMLTSVAIVQFENVQALATEVCILSQKLMRNVCAQHHSFVAILCMVRIHAYKYTLV